MLLEKLAYERVPSPYDEQSRRRWSISRRRQLRRLVRTILVCLFFIPVPLIVLTYFFRPSYTHLPAHYLALRHRASQSHVPGRGNPFNESIFISISLYDKGGHLAAGEWGRNLLTLVDLLGPENTFLSIYENDSGFEAAGALRALERSVTGPHSFIIEDVDKQDFPKINMPDGSKRLKRLTYLSEMRNRALMPINSAATSNFTFDKVLFFNDVSFDPLDAINLLFSTNMGRDGRAHYTAACGLDFMDPFKFYDVYAARDLEGYSMGHEIFPFFGLAGNAQSRKDVLAQKDAVRVKSCWSGMAAFDAKPFQLSPHEKLPSVFNDIGAHVIDPDRPRMITAPIAWRSEPEVFFDACECCLLMADALALSNPSNIEVDTGIYINPYVRVAYSAEILWWLRHVRRVERLFSGFQWIVTVLRGLPTWNEHRNVEQGQAFEEEIWNNNASLPLGGAWKIVDRTARNGMYCGVREMQVLLESERIRDKNWENTYIAAGRRLF